MCSSALGRDFSIACGGLLTQSPIESSMLPPTHSKEFVKKKMASDMVEGGLDAYNKGCPQVGARVGPDAQLEHLRTISPAVGLVVVLKQSWLMAVCS